MDNPNNFKILLDKLEVLENKINNIEIKIDDINNKLSNCETSCKTMDQHINFVEDTYQTLRTPLNFIKSQIDYMTGNANEKTLPQLKDKEI